MKTISLGAVGEDVTTLQRALSSKGYYTVADGVFGTGTQSNVITFQSVNRLTPDGVVGSKTWEALGVTSTPTPSTPGFSPIVKWYPLNQGQYVTANNTPIGICLHHTVSAGSPYMVVDGWNLDNRGAVGTHFVIGGIALNGDNTHDGTIIQCVNLKDIVYHLNTTRMGKSTDHNYNANRLYIGIEICAYGCLTEKNGRYYTMDGANREVPAEYVEILPTPWRTFKYWHKYSPKQIEATINLIKELNTKLNLGISKATLEKEVSSICDLSWEAQAFQRKLTSHSSFEDGKFDIYPSFNLLSALKSMY
jgi:N-acetyl-anhydromuramyl-L-alanine amidase AmpD